MTKGLTFLALAVVALLNRVTTLAETDKTGFYVGGNIGLANFSTGSFDESSAGFGAYAGYRFIEFFELESTLFNLPRVS